MPIFGKNYLKTAGCFLLLFYKFFQKTITLFLNNAFVYRVNNCRKKKVRLN